MILDQVIIQPSSSKHSVCCMTDVAYAVAMQETSYESCCHQFTPLNEGSLESIWFSTLSRGTGFRFDYLLAPFYDLRFLTTFGL